VPVLIVAFSFPSPLNVVPDPASIPEERLLPLDSVDLGLSASAGPVIVCASGEEVIVAVDMNISDAEGGIDSSPPVEELVSGTVVRDGRRHVGELPMEIVRSGM